MSSSHPGQYTRGSSWRASRYGINMVRKTRERPHTVELAVNCQEFLSYRKGNAEINKPYFTGPPLPRYAQLYLPDNICQIYALHDNHSRPISDKLSTYDRQPTFFLISCYSYRGKETRRGVYSALICPQGTRWCGPPARGGFRRQNRHPSLVINGHRQTSSTPVKSAQIHRFSTALSGYVRLKQPVRSAGYRWLPPDFGTQMPVQTAGVRRSSVAFSALQQCPPLSKSSGFERLSPVFSILKTVGNRPNPAVLAGSCHPENRSRPSNPAGFNNGFFYQPSLIYNYAQDYIFSLF
ncbi:hypothetical protein C8F04DRAFT_1311903 [Mycena alexandri]|uniref:Uncharacterized protein n=1 Tax=Mycena alexandri TaxID=1745969 RepID=A0AAD6WR53_9AGAR|nr:hypothetical protein C8F04DRAFT_1311903 [Mycena alexandri]